MGRPSPVLTVVVDKPWGEHPAMVELRQSGHRVLTLLDWAGQTPVVIDLILHPAAGWSEELFEEVERKDGTTHRPYVEAALVRARARRKK